MKDLYKLDPKHVVRYYRGNGDLWDKYLSVYDDGEFRHPIPSDFRLIQRGRVKEDGTIEYDYMGATEFEVGSLRRRFTEEGMGTGRGALIIKEGGKRYFINYVYNARFWNEAGVHRMLQALFEGKIHTKEYTRFNARDLDGAKDEKNRHAPDCWFDITGGLFWTTGRLQGHFYRYLEQWKNTGDLPKPIEKAPEVSAKDKKSASIRDQLIREGKIKPVSGRS